MRGKAEGGQEAKAGQRRKKFKSLGEMRSTFVVVSVMELLLSAVPLVLLVVCYCCFGSTASAFSSSSSISCFSRNHHHHRQHSFSLAGATAAAIDTTTAQNKNKELPPHPILQQQNNNPSAFEILAQKAIYTLLKSDSDTDENEHAYGSASQGLWINSKAAKEMQNVLDRIVLQVSLYTLLIYRMMICLFVNEGCNTMM